MVPEPTDADAEANAPESVDDVLQRLEGVVRALEGGELTLEDQLAQFEEGVRLARRGGALLDAVEQRVERLLADGETVPFESTDPKDD